MIIITLKSGQNLSLRLGPDVKITLLAARDGEARLSIDSPEPGNVAVGGAWQAISRACREKEAREKAHAKAAAQSFPAPVEAPPPAPDAPGQAGRPPSGD